jgi:hypothetical protein
MGDVEGELIPSPKDKFPKIPIWGWAVRGRGCCLEG